MDCLICFERHSTSDCLERKPQNCPDCHNFIRRFSDHSLVCGMKRWTFQPYKHLYATPPFVRVIIGCNSPIRFLYDGNWRKPFFGEDLYSPESGAIVRFKNENDICLLSRGFAPIRIAFVVKENANFAVKLMLSSSFDRFIVAEDLDEPFDRSMAEKNHQWKTTLIVAMASTDDLRVNVMALPPQKPERLHELIFDAVLKKFRIPVDLASTPSPEMMIPKVYLK